MDLAAHNESFARISTHSMPTIRASRILVVIQSQHPGVSLVQRNKSSRPERPWKPPKHGIPTFQYPGRIDDQLPSPCHLLLPQI